MLEFVFGFIIGWTVSVLVLLLAERRITPPVSIYKDIPDLPTKPIRPDNAKVRKCSTDTYRAEMKSARGNQ